jgi:hypothetical protein
MIQIQMTLSVLVQKMTQIKKRNEAKLLKSIVSRKIQHSLRSYLKKYAADGKSGELSINRDERRIQVCMFTSSMLSYNTIQKRSKQQVVGFLEQQYGYQNLFLKIKKYCQKVEHI